MYTDKIETMYTDKRAQIAMFWHLKLLFALQGGQTDLKIITCTLIEDSSEIKQIGRLKSHINFWGRKMFFFMENVGSL